MVCGAHDPRERIEAGPRAARDRRAGDRPLPLIDRLAHSGRSPPRAKRSLPHGTSAGEHSCGAQYAGSASSASPVDVGISGQSHPPGTHEIVWVELSPSPSASQVARMSMWPIALVGTIAYEQ